MIPPQSLIVILLMIIAPFILYAFFFLIKCTPNPFHLFGRGGRDDSSSHQEPEKPSEEEKNSNMEMIKAVGSNLECPVCLSVFKEGEELKQIKICKHYFHQSCIDTWLSSHFNCPVCRAFVSNKRVMSKGRENQRGRDLHRDDLWQGLPGSSGLV